MLDKDKFNPEQYTKYEKARILGARALQISANAPILIKLSKEQLEALNYDPIKIAELEFEEGVLPITVKRPLPKKIETKEEEIVEIVKEETPLESDKKEAASKDKEESTKTEEIGEEIEEGEAEEISEEAVLEELSKEESEETEEI